MAKKIGRYVVVGTDKDGDLGSWNDLDADTWTAPWGVYDTRTETFEVTGIRWKWVARLLAWMESRT